MIQEPARANTLLLPSCPYTNPYVLPHVPSPNEQLRDTGSFKPAESVKIVAAAHHQQQDKATPTTPVALHCQQSHSRLSICSSALSPCADPFTLQTPPRSSRTSGAYTQAGIRRVATEVDLLQLLQLQQQQQQLRNDCHLLPPASDPAKVRGVCCAPEAVGAGAGSPCVTLSAHAPHGVP